MLEGLGHGFRTCPPDTAKRAFGIAIDFLEAHIREEILSAQFLETQALDMGGASGIGRSDSNVKAEAEER